MTQSGMTGRRVALPILGMVLLGGTSCSRPQVDTVASYTGRPLRYPDRILVLDFGVHPEDVRLDQGLRARLTRAMSGQAPSAQQLAAAREASAALTEALVSELRSYGLPAERVAGLPSAAMANVVLIEGQIAAIDQGNQTRRTMIGLGAGRSSMRADSQVYHQAGGAPPRLLEAFSASIDSGRAPGAAETMGAGAAVGHLATSAATTAGMHGLSELRSSDSTAEARTLGKALARQIGQFFVQQGWVAASAVR